MTSLNTEKLTLPTEVADGIIRKAQESSVVQTLSPSQPAYFKNVENILFTKEPEAEFVGEGQKKSSSDVEFQAVKGVPHKAQVTIRMNDEVKWADEDGQLQIIDSITAAAGDALGRALDYGVIHGINPKTGEAVDKMDHITADAYAKTVTATADATADLDSLIEAVNEDYDIDGIAMSKTWANTLRKIRVPSTGQRLYPEIPLNLKAGSLDGIAAVTSRNVNGPLATAATNVLSIVGDWSTVKWGTVRDFGLEIIQYGDPDGLGDLKNLNQIAYRVEIVWSWGIIAFPDLKPFALLKAATA